MTALVLPGLDADAGMWQVRTEADSAALALANRHYPRRNRNGRHIGQPGRKLVLVTPCPPGHPGDWVLVFGHTVLERSGQVGHTPNDGPIFRRRHLGTDVGREAMGIDWMNRDELSEAIPPAYTRHLGQFLLQHLECAA